MFVIPTVFHKKNAYLFAHWLMNIIYRKATTRNRLSTVIKNVKLVLAERFELAKLII